jgi:hypothetical protein
MKEGSKHKARPHFWHTLCFYSKHPSYEASGSKHITTGGDAPRRNWRSEKMEAVVMDKNIRKSVSMITGPQE